MRHFLFHFLVFFGCVCTILSQPAQTFTENKGQWHKAYTHGHHSGSFELYMQPSGWQIYLLPPRTDLHEHGHAHGGTSSEGLSDTEHKSTPEGAENSLIHGLSYKFTGTRTIEGQGLGAYLAITNYYLGNDSTRWGRGAKSYSQLSYCDLYPNIDMYTRIARGLKYDLVIRPGGKVSDILLEIKGADALWLENNTIHLSTVRGTLQESIPTSYQIIGQDTIYRAVRYVLRGKNRIGFEIENYDKKAPLIIDPELVAASYVGSHRSVGHAGCFDEFGNTYVMGRFWTGAASVILKPTLGVVQESILGVTNIGIVKFNTDGTDVLYFTYLGGSANNQVASAIVHPSGDLIVYGITDSDDFPTTEDAYNRNLSPHNSTSERRLILPSNDNGHNTSDIILARISPDGTNLVGSTYIGGSDFDGLGSYNETMHHKHYGDGLRGEVVVDPIDEEIVVASFTSSSDFPATPPSTFKGSSSSSYGRSRSEPRASGNSTDASGNSDGILFKMSADLQVLRWARYVGGSEDDRLISVKATSTGYYATGATLSNDLPFGSLASSYQRTKVSDLPASSENITSADIDGFIVHLLRDNQNINYGTYIGTPKRDYPYFLEIGPKGNVYVHGQSNGEDYPVQAATGSVVFSERFGRMFIHKFSPDLSTSLFSTVLGANSEHIDARLSGRRGDANWIPSAFLVSDCEDIYLSGWGGNLAGGDRFNGSTTDLTVTSDAPQSATDGNDFYLAVLSPNASDLSFATFHGGVNAADHQNGGMSRFDKRGIVYQAVCECSAHNFPTTPGAWSERSGVNNCNIAFFKYAVGSTVVKFSTNNQADTDPGISSGCIPLTIVFKNETKGGNFISEWDFGDGTFTSVDDRSITRTFETVGTYKVRLRVTPAGGVGACGTDVQIVEKDITVFNDTVAVSDDLIICKKEEVQLFASGGVSYQWTPPENLSDTHMSDPILSQLQTSAEYNVEITTPNGCKKNESVLVTVAEVSIDELNIEGIDLSCAGTKSIQLSAEISGADYTIWHMGDGNSFENTSSLNYTYKGSGYYTVQVTASNDVCTATKEQRINSSSFFVPNVITPNGDGINDHLEIESLTSVSLNIYDRHGNLVHKAATYQNDWNGGELPAGVYYYGIKIAQQHFCKGWIHLVK